MTESERELLELILRVPEGGEYDFRALGALKQAVIVERQAWAVIEPAMERLWVEGRKAKLRSDAAMNELAKTIPGRGPVKLTAEQGERWGKRADAEFASESGAPTIADRPAKRPRRPS